MRITSYIILALIFLFPAEIIIFLNAIWVMPLVAIIFYTILVLGYRRGKISSVDYKE